jgi:hypothetical protein
MQTEEIPMRYFMSIILSPEQEGASVPQALQDAMGPYLEKNVASGALISTAGLKRTATGKRIVARDGKATTVDGPFAEAKEVVGGYAVVEARSFDAAVAIAQEFVDLHTDNGWPDVTVEVREIEGGINY